MVAELKDALLPTFSADRWAALLIIAIKTTLIYVFLVLGLRLGGKRELGEMSVYDVVLIVVLGNAVQNAMVGNDATVGGGLVAATTLLILNYLLSLLLERWDWLHHLLVGRPVVISRHGKKLQEVMRREGVTDEELDAALRAHGLDDVSKSDRCILETTGDISVISGDSNVRPRRQRRAKGLKRQ